MQVIIAALAALLSRGFALLVALVSFQIAKKIAIATSFILVSAALFLSVSVSIKAAVEAVRVAMPTTLAPFTYFLPSSINHFIAAIVLVRLMNFLWAWSRENLRIYSSTFMK